jgi:hypothetical protein
LRDIAQYCAILRDVAQSFNTTNREAAIPQTALLRVIERYSALLRVIARYCALLCVIAHNCALLRVIV